MEPLDLTKAPPRAPREQLAGLYFLSRTIDKVRAQLPGGNPGQYYIPGFSQRLLDALGIDLEELTRVVALAHTDDEVADWVRKHSDPSKYDEINRKLSTRSWAMLDDEGKARVEGIYGPDVRTHATLFDAMLADDAKIFAKNQ